MDMFGYESGASLSRNKQEEVWQATWLGCWLCPLATELHSNIPFLQLLSLGSGTLSLLLFLQTCKCQRQWNVLLYQVRTEHIRSMCSFTPMQSGSLMVPKLYKSYLCSLAGVAQYIECWPANQRVTGLIPSLGHMPGLWAMSPVRGM